MVGNSILETNTKLKKSFLYFEPKFAY